MAHFYTWRAVHTWKVPSSVSHAANKDLPAIILGIHVHIQGMPHQTNTYAVSVSPRPTSVNGAQPYTPASASRMSTSAALFCAHCVTRARASIMHASTKCSGAALLVNQLGIRPLQPSVGAARLPFSSSRQHNVCFARWQSVFRVFLV